MYQSVARATGESLRRVRRMGFLLVVPCPAAEPRHEEEIRPGAESDRDPSGDAHAPRLA
jgi:hypothetical protein